MCVWKFLLTRFFLKPVLRDSTCRTLPTFVRNDVVASAAAAATATVRKTLHRSPPANRFEEGPPVYVTGPRCLARLSVRTVRCPAKPEAKPLLASLTTCGTRVGGSDQDQHKAEQEWHRMDEFAGEHIRACLLNRGMNLALLDSEKLWRCGGASWEIR